MNIRYLTFPWVQLAFWDTCKCIHTVPAKNNATRDFSRSGCNISATNNIQNLLSVHQILFFISSLLSKLNRIKMWRIAWDRCNTSFNSQIGSVMNASLCTKTRYTRRKPVVHYWEILVLGPLPLRKAQSINPTWDTLIQWSTIVLTKSGPFLL